jgi:16S rRNA (guanine527-N7)-methyltransferase
MLPLAAESRELLGIPLTDEQISRFDNYARLLLAWNERINLTAIRTLPAIRIKHFLDALTCLTVMPDPIGRVIDVGTGAGLPGLALKIARPEIRLTLVESVHKKADFCRLAAAELGLAEVDILSERVELVGHLAAHRAGYDWAVARALAGMPVLAEYLLPLVRVGGHILAQKGGNAPQEVDSALGAIRTLGGRVTRIQPVALPGVDELHHLVVIEKIAPTPAAYPRRVGVPHKQPLP